MNSKLILDVISRYVIALCVGAFLKLGLEQQTADTLGPAVGAALLLLVWVIARNTQLRNKFPEWFTDQQAVELGKQIVQGKKTLEEVPGKVTPTAPKDPYIGHGNSGNTL